MLGQKGSTSTGALSNKKFGKLDHFDGKFIFKKETF
jgi:hypothetical protein